ncbi:pancreatic triacylglycerol lipase-like [Sitophilus oryzae]|uniref:Pancreatic triacylglycerol lipase-like n=1 Tax=Sitophilus oryzae TaxID=7048 RepID=A0A6J2XCY6_SITOR|nr:pancreatic triacylglycerol lipase-like [Sitophilus oryzae]
MARLFIIVLLFPIVFSKPRSAYDSELSYEDYQEILQLKALTKQYEAAGVAFEPLDALKFDDSDISFYVYTKNDVNGTQVLYNEGNQIANISSFNTSLRTVFVAHGWKNNYISTVGTVLKEALFETEDLNVILLDWDAYANNVYITSYNAVPKVGRVTGLFIKNITSSYNYSTDNITIMGHSLGAHIAGFAGQETNGSLAFILGMDPAGVLYFENFPDARLSEGDAQYVEAVHTDASLLGVYYSVGNSDFWPNGGKSQPGCELDVFGSCAHGRSYLYIGESITNNNFYSRECDSYSDYIAGECTNNIVAMMGGPTHNTSITGNYYLRTNSSSPYSLGDISS